MDNNGDSKREISRETLKDLNTIRKWAMFLSIVGFIASGAFLVTGLFTGIFLSVFNVNENGPGFPAWLAFIIFILLFLLLLLPVIYLFRFSKFTSEAIKTNDDKKLRRALSNLKAHYLYLGILVIIILVVYFFVMISTMLSMGFVKNIG